MAMKNFTIQDATELYGVKEWGYGYFGINSKGHLEVCPTQDENLSVDVYEIVQHLRKKGVHTPLLLRSFLFFSFLLPFSVEQVRCPFPLPVPSTAFLTSEAPSQCEMAGSHRAEQMARRGKPIALARSHTRRAVPN